MFQLNEYIFGKASYHVISYSLHACSVFLRKMAKLIWPNLRFLGVWSSLLLFSLTECQKAVLVSVIFANATKAKTSK